MGATLANNGVNPITGDQVIKRENVPEILSAMTMAGLYDGSGGWAWHVGLPAKSGVGGGFVAVVPGKGHDRCLRASSGRNAGNSVESTEDYCLRGRKARHQLVFAAIVRVEVICSRSLQQQTKCGSERPPCVPL